MTRSAMTLRAEIERAPADVPTAWGTPAAPVFVPVGTVACRLHVKDVREVRDDGKLAHIRDVRIAFPRRADVLEGDRVAAVRDRKGTVMLAGPLAIRALRPSFSPGGGSAHLLASLEGHT